MSSTLLITGTSGGNAPEGVIPPGVPALNCWLTAVVNALLVAAALRVATAEGVPDLLSFRAEALSEELSLAVGDDVIVSSESKYGGESAYTADNLLLV